MDEFVLHGGCGRGFSWNFCMGRILRQVRSLRVGTKQMHELLHKICEGEGSPSDLALLEELAPMVRETSLCGLGMTAPTRCSAPCAIFRDEIQAHIVEKRCPAGVCKMKSAQNKKRCTHEHPHYDHDRR